MDRWKLNWATGTYEPELFANTGRAAEPPPTSAAPAEPDQQPVNSPEIGHPPSLGPYAREPGYYDDLPQPERAIEPAAPIQTETPSVVPEPTREERYAAREALLQDKVDQDRIDRHEMYHDLRQYDSELLGEMIQEDREQARDEARRAREESDKAPSPEPAPPEHKADALYDERMQGREMTDAQQARFERFMDMIDDTPEMDMSRDDGMDRGGGRTM